MKGTDFELLKMQFQNSDVDGKIDIYMSAAGLNYEQNMLLLDMLPQDAIGKLENSLKN